MNLARLVTALQRRTRLAWLRALSARELGRAQRCSRGLQTAPGARRALPKRRVLDYDTTIECSGTLNVGERVIFGYHCTIGCKERIEIGDDCLLAEMVSIRDYNHNFARSDVPIRAQGATCAR